MCLAVPGKVIACAADEAVVDFQGNTVRVSTVLTPDVRVGSWVLVHAGFSITVLDEREALETWDYLHQILDDGAGPTDGLSTTATADERGACEPRVAEPLGEPDGAEQPGRGLP